VRKPSDEAVQPDVGHDATSMASGAASGGARQAAALRRAMLPLNGVRVLACLWIMVRPYAESCNCSRIAAGFNVPDSRHQRLVAP
jgi:hypothetical protein